MVTGVLDELIMLANAQECTFPADFKEKTIRSMTQPQETNSTMWMDFEAKRPMEIETYLGSPLKLAQEVNVTVPRIETLYATLHHINIVNRTRPAAGPTPTPAQNMQQPPGPPPRLSSAPLPRGPPGPNGPMPMMNGNGPMKGGPRPGSTFNHRRPTHDASRPTTRHERVSTPHERRSQWPTSPIARGQRSGGVFAFNAVR
jgi:hypothetical protein